MEPLKIKMVKTEKGSPNGLDVYTYDEGAEYTVPFSLGNVFLEIGVAVDTEAEEKAAVKAEREKIKARIKQEEEEEKARVKKDKEEDDALKAAEKAAADAAKLSARSTKPQDPKIEKKEG